MEEVVGVGGPVGNCPLHQDEIREVVAATHRERRRVESFFTLRNRTITQLDTEISLTLSGQG
jgi:hypothetical protein